MLVEKHTIYRIEISVTVNTTVESSQASLTPPRKSTQVGVSSEGGPAAPSGLDATIAHFLQKHEEKWVKWNFKFQWIDTF